MQAAITADIIGSRSLPDRDLAQRHLLSVFASVSERLSLPPMLPTIGDEFQRAYPDLEQALALTLLVSLALPRGVGVRFGVGWGQMSGEGADFRTWDGPAWWAAREAVDHVRRLQKRNAPHARTWLVAARDDAEGMSDAVRSANAYLLARDHIIGAMSDRGRRLTLGRLYGRSQRELAESEGITQSAVSQALAAAGAGAIVEGFDALMPGVRS